MAYPMPPAMQFGMFGGVSGPGFWDPLVSSSMAIPTRGLRPDVQSFADVPVEAVPVVPQESQPTALQRRMQASSGIVVRGGDAAKFIA
jgi:hypothetical protein